MSKMPAKKKSCFQITSVTTAQAASSITEDTESLDDPDESRTEDVSSEIFDVSRATDFGPEDVVERSSSEETLNNVGEAETPGTTSPNLPQEVRAPPAPGPAPHHPGPAASSVTPASPATSTAACSSRFRVIKLDHGSGEPYRRGRWTCTEFYERDSDGSVITRTADSIRHYDHTADRDSGLGQTGGSVHVAGPEADTPLPAVPPVTGQQQQHLVLPAGGTVSQGGAQPVYPHLMGQSYIHAQSGQNVAQAGIAHQQTNISGGQFTYTQGHMMGTQVSGQADYVPHPSALQSQGSAQMAAGTGALSSLPGVQAAGAQVLGPHTKPGDPVSQGSGLVPSAPTAQSHPVHPQQAGGVASIAGGTPKSISQQQVTGSSQLSNIPGGHHAVPPGLPHSVPSSGVSGITSSVPSVSATPVTMPIAPSTFVQSPLSSQTSVSRSNSLVPSVGLPPVQGTSTVHTSLPQSTVSQFQSQPLAGHIDDRRKSEPLPQPPIPLISEKSFVKVPITDPLTNPLLPVFGLPISVDGEDDSSTSANVVAIDNKIEQAMDLVKSHLMYAVREEVEVLKEQIKDLIEKNCTLERENALLKSLSNSDQLSQLPTQVGLGTCQQPPPVTTAPHTAPQTAHPPQQPNVSSA
ncbi:TSC22 domain family protein 2 isoform 1-T1 [Anomaloglossus baeobatrachus]|uniref:TSC22 domain family protein 2 isoform X1 n=1 Tax=Anomaloglossus baeobatrachus TaxID=238106 RepID=UPI003F502E6C